MARQVPNFDEPAQENEITPSMTPYANRVKFGYLRYNPFPTAVPVPPQVYSCGYHCQGNIIGANVPVPYPIKGEKPFKPNTGSFNGCTIDARKGTTQVSSNVESTRGCEPEENVPEIDEYFTAGNDEGYQKWVEKKQEKERRKEEQKYGLKNCNTPNTYANVSMPVQENYPASHYMPSTFVTANRTYGGYIDLQPNCQSIIEKRPSTRDLNAPTFAYNDIRSNVLDVHNMVQHKLINQKIPYNVPTPASIFSLPRQGDVIGIREPGFTFPIYTKTGLELNRPCGVGANMFASMSKQKFHHKRAPFRPQTFAYMPKKRFQTQRSVCVPYCIKPPNRQMTLAGVNSQPMVEYACMTTTDRMTS